MPELNRRRVCLTGKSEKRYEQPMMNVELSTW